MSTSSLDAAVGRSSIVGQPSLARRFFGSGSSCLSPLVPASFLAALFVCATVFSQASVAQDVSAGGVQSSEGRHVLLSTPSEVGGQPVTRIVLDVQGPAEVGHTPDGWTFETTGAGIELVGEPLPEDGGRFRLDIPDDVMWDGARVTLYGPNGELATGVVNPPTEYPDLEVQSDASSFLLAPDQASAGEPIRMEVKDEDLVGVGKWKVEGTPASGVADSEFLAARIPGAMRPGDFASLTYEDVFGLEIISDQEGIEIVGSLDGEDAEPALTGCTPRVFRGRVACICGVFPTSEIQGGLMLDGQPLGTPNAGSSQVVYVEIPESVAPGTHTITGAGIEGSIEIIVLAARGEIDIQRIQEGGSTPLRVVVEGTDEPLQLLLRNLAPDIIELEGGVEQTVETTGGATNSFERIVTGLAPGAFDVYYELAEDPCPCLESNDVNIAENDPGGTRTRDPQTDSTRTRPPWWPEDPEGDDPRDVPVPPVYGEEEDDEEDEMCCGFKGPLLVWPQTTDPLAQSAPLAPHTPAVAGVQVHLGSGAYFHNDRDLEQEAIGIPFDLLRHYTSDAETVAGGFMGHRWDFSYNKRLVALGRDYADGLRGQLAETEESVVMYFDGMGRALRYVEKTSGYRFVLNFGVRGQFRAYVTTYTSPDGEFNELQRYVMEDPSAHPFGDHVDVEENESIFFVLREKNGVRYIFNCRGQLIHILSANDYASLPAGQTRDEVRYTLTYRGPRNPLTQNNTLSEIIDPSGRRYGFTTKDIDEAIVNTNDDCIHITGTLPIPRLRKIWGPGVEITYKYKDNDTTPALETVRRVYKIAGSDSIATETRYAYDGEFRLTSVTAPEQVANGGGPYIRNKYDGAGRVETQWLGGDRHSSFAYAGSSVIVTSAAGPKRTFKLKQSGDYKLVEEETVSEGSGTWTTRFGHNKSTQVTSTTLPRGNRIVYLYDEGNESVTEGPMRNDVQAGVTYHNNLSLGNLLGIRRERGTVPKGDGPESIATAREYEPLYNKATKVTDANGNSTTFQYEYDEQGVLGQPVEESPPNLTQPDGSVVTLFPRSYSYTTKGLLESEAVTPFDVTDYEYDDKGQLVAIKSGHGNQTFNRDFFGRIRSRTGPDGAIRYERDARGLPIEEFYEEFRENKKRYEYDLNGALVKTTIDVVDNFSNREVLVGNIRAPESKRRFERVTTIDRDVIGRPLVEATTAGGLTRIIKRAFDAEGRVTRTEEPSPAGGVLVTEYTLDGRGYATTTTYGGLETRRTFDENGNVLTSETGPQGKARKMSYTYDAFDRQISETDPLGTATTRKLDDKGNVVMEEIRGNDGEQNAGTATLAKTEITYNEHDLVKTKTTHLLGKSGGTQIEKNFYNRIAKLTRAEAPGDVVTQYGYDELGRLKEMVDPVGNKTVYEYGAYDRRSSVAQVETERTYEPIGREWTETTKEYKTTFSYDAIGRILTSTAPEASAAYRYNSDGMRRLAALAQVGVSDTQYDGLGRQEKVVTAGAEQTFKYNLANRVVESQSPHQHTRWKYDDQGNTLESENVLTGAKTTYERDDVGNPIAITDANGTVIRSTFNEAGLPLVDRIQWGTTKVNNRERNLNVVIGPTLTWRRYDGLGRLRYAQNGNATDDRKAGVALEYDGLGRIIHEEQSQQSYGQTIDRTYAADESWMETRYPEIAGSAKVRRHYDKLGRVVRVDLDGEMVASYAYSGSDRIAGQSLRNGTVAVYSYDDKRRMTETKVWSEAGPYYGNPEIIFSSRATYTSQGRLAETLMVDQARHSSTTTKYTYDELGRTTGSVSTTSIGGAKPSQTVSRLMTRYAGGKPAVQAELLTETQGEYPVPQFARVQSYVYDKGRVASVRTTARDKFEGRVPEISNISDLVTWMAGDGLFSDTQRFKYDGVGNIVADDANTYQYDASRRLIKVAQMPGNRPYNQSTTFKYDPLGRRVQATPGRDRTPGGFVNWAPWNRTDAWFLYDGLSVIGEGTGSFGGARLIARYIAGARPDERVRMDRRANDDPNGAFAPFYLHPNMQGQIALLTDGDGKSLSTSSPSSSQAGSPLAPPADERFITGTTTRSPYLSGTVRIDGYAGVKYDEKTQNTIYDYRTSPIVAEALNMEAYRQSITAMQNRGAIALMTVTGAALAPGAAAFGALINVGLNWSAAAWTDSPYTPGEAAEHVAQGAMSAGIAKLIPGGSTMMQKFWADYAGDLVTGVSFDVGLRNKSWSEALTTNAINSFASAGVGAGLRIGAAGVGLGYAAVKTRLKAAEAVSGDVGPATKAAAATDESYVPGRTGDVFSSIVKGARGPGRDIALQNETLSLLMNGNFYHRHIARKIMSGELTVHWDYNLPMRFGGLWHPNTPNAIYLNPWVYRSNPSAALGLASVIVHEATHAMGGGELSAHIAQGQFIHMWYNQKGRKTTSFGSQRLQYHLRGVDIAVTRAVYQTALTHNLAYINQFLHKANYHPDKAFFIKVGHINALHLPIRQAGGWGTVLALHPALDARLNAFARRHGGLNY